MPVVEHRGQLLWFTAPGPATDMRALPDGTLAVGLAQDHACALTVDGSVYDIHRTETRFRRRLVIPDGVTRAAISGGGDLVVAAIHGNDDERCTVLRLVGDTWEYVPGPDFLCAVTDLRCAPSGKTFVYVYRSSQPWSEHGSYGNRLYGWAILDSNGRPLREFWDCRQHDDYLDRRIPAWGAHGDPMILVTGRDPNRRYDSGITEVVCGGQPRSAMPSWDQGPAGSTPYDDEQCICWFTGEVIAAALSPTGNIVAAASDDLVHLLDLRRNVTREIAIDAIALRISDHGILDVITTTGVWRRLPIDADGWQPWGE